MAYEEPWGHALMGFMDSGGEYHEARNVSHWLDQKRPSYPIQNFSENTNYDTTAVQISEEKEDRRKATGMVKDLLECWDFTYRNCPNKMKPYMAELAKWSIQEYIQSNSSMIGNRGSQGIKYGRGQKYSTRTRSMFAERRTKLYQSWNGEVFSSVDHDWLMCEMVDPSTSRYA